MWPFSPSRPPNLTPVHGSNGVTPELAERIGRLTARQLRRVERTIRRDERERDDRLAQGISDKEHIEMLIGQLVERSSS